MRHNVSSVQTLHDDAYALYNNVVIGGSEYSSDTIIANLASGIENLKNSWKGKDAGVQIENVVKVHNAMVEIRETLAVLATVTSKIAANYREIQNSNGAGLETFSYITSDSKTILPDYTDMADTINITPDANNGRVKIDAASTAIDQFISEAKRYYNNIMQNWTAGTEREELISRFETLISNSNTYKETLNSVSQSIRTALSNYGL
jgi:uncharacterized protein YukE